MAQFNTAWLEHERRRWLPPSADWWVRPDPHRWTPPNWQGRTLADFYLKAQPEEGKKKKTDQQTGSENATNPVTGTEPDKKKKKHDETATSPSGSNNAGPANTGNATNVIASRRDRRVIYSAPPAAWRGIDAYPDRLGHAVTIAVNGSRV